MIKIQARVMLPDKAVGEFNYQHANMLISVGYFNVFRNFAV